MNRFSKLGEPFTAADYIVTTAMFTVYCLLLACMSGCKYMPDNSATWEEPRRLLPCEVVPPGYPCQAPVVHDDSTACDKRFGKRVCGGAQ